MQPTQLSDSRALRFFSLSLSSLSTSQFRVENGSDRLIDRPDYLQTASTIFSFSFADHLKPGPYRLHHYDYPTSLHSLHCSPLPSNHSKNALQSRLTLSPSSPIFEFTIPEQTRLQEPAASALPLRVITIPADAPPNHRALSTSLQTIKKYRAEDFERTPETQWLGKWRPPSLVLSPFY